MIRGGMETLSCSFLPRTINCNAREPDVRLPLTHPVCILPTGHGRQPASGSHALFDGREGGDDSKTRSQALAGAWGRATAEQVQRQTIFGFWRERSIGKPCLPSFGVAVAAGSRLETLDEPPGSEPWQGLTGFGAQEGSGNADLRPIRGDFGEGGFCRLCLRHSGCVAAHPARRASSYLPLRAGRAVERLGTQGVCEIAGQLQAPLAKATWQKHNGRISLKDFSKWLP